MALNYHQSYRRALIADGAKIEGYVFLRNGFKTEGEVNFLGATIRAKPRMRWRSAHQS